MNANDPEDPELEVYDHAEIFKTLMTPGFMYQTEDSLTTPMQRGDVRASMIVIVDLSVIVIIIDVVIAMRVLGLGLARGKKEYITGV